MAQYNFNRATPLVILNTDAMESDNTAPSSGLFSSFAADDMETGGKFRLPGSEKFYFARTIRLHRGIDVPQGRQIFYGACMVAPNKAQMNHQYYYSFVLAGELTSSPGLQILPCVARIEVPSTTSGNFHSYDADDELIKIAQYLPFRSCMIDAGSDAHYVAGEGGLISVDEDNDDDYYALGFHFINSASGSRSLDDIVMSLTLLRYEDLLPFYDPQAR